MLDPRKPDDPYCAFKNDRERRIALISRNVRDVLIALAVAGTYPTMKGLEWLKTWLP